MHPVITVSNLTKSYPLPKAKNGEREFLAVKGTSFEVYKGEIFGILGPNGAGKTTTLEIIEGLKPQTSGTVEVLGFDNLKQTDEIKRRIGIQLQSSEYLHHLTLGELLDLFASLYKDNKNQINTNSPSPSLEKRGKTQNPHPNSRLLLSLVSLQDKEHSRVADLSGGQKQRFTIATSLVHNPDILFLDEPTTGLDPKARRDLWELIKKLNSEGLTIVMTTHYMEEAEYLCHRVAIMDEGKILEIDEPKKLIDRMSDTTQISFFTDQKLDESLFKTIPEISKVVAEYPKVILEISSLDKISAVVQTLKSRAIPFYGFTVRTASLEDVYLDLTGKEYEEV